MQGALHHQDTSEAHAGARTRIAALINRHTDVRPLHHGDTSGGKQSHALTLESRTETKRMQQYGMKRLHAFKNKIK